MAILEIPIHEELYIYIFKHLRVRDMKQLASTSKSIRSYVLSWKPASERIDGITYKFMKNRFSDFEWRMLMGNISFSKILQRIETICTAPENHENVKLQILIKLSKFPEKVLLLAINNSSYGVKKYIQELLDFMHKPINEVYNKINDSSNLLYASMTFVFYAHEIYRHVKRGTECEMLSKIKNIMRERSFYPKLLDLHTVKLIKLWSLPVVQPPNDISIQVCNTCSIRHYHVLIKFIEKYSLTIDKIDQYLINGFIKNNDDCYDQLRYEFQNNHDSIRQRYNLASLRYCDNPKMYDRVSECARGTLLEIKIGNFVNSKIITDNISFIYY